MISNLGRKQNLLNQYKLDLVSMENSLRFKRNSLDQTDIDDLESEIYMMENIISDLEFEIMNQSNN